MATKCKRRKHLIRPPADDLRREAAYVVEGRVQRLTPVGRWVRDDGVSPGLAFTAGVVAYYPGPRCECFGNNGCIARMAMNHVSAHHQYGSANGQEVLKYVEFVEKLSKAQHKYLSALAANADMRPYNGLHYSRTRRVLERRGLVKHNVAPGHGGKRWTITDAGRAAMSGGATETA
jgi:hypothetical protein